MEEEKMDEIRVCPTCGFEEDTDDCTCDPWMRLPPGETRMDYLVTRIKAKSDKEPRLQTEK
jgi:hypothetical protein